MRTRCMISDRLPNRGRLLSLSSLFALLTKSLQHFQPHIKNDKTTSTFQVQVSQKLIDTCLKLEDRYTKSNYVIGKDTAAKPTRSAPKHKAPLKTQLEAQLIVHTAIQNPKESTFSNAPSEGTAISWEESGRKWSKVRFSSKFQTRH